VSIFQNYFCLIEYLNKSLSGSLILNGEENRRNIAEAGNYLFSTELIGDLKTDK